MKTLFLALFLMLSQIMHAHAYESDQFTVPDKEFADVGDDVSIFIYNQTKLAVDKINNDLKELPEKIEKTRQAIDTDEAREKPFMMRDLKSKLKIYTERLKLIQTKQGVVTAVYDELGGVFTWEDQRDGVFGLPLSIIPYPKNVKDGKIITYVASRSKNIYAWAGFHRLISPSYFVFCSSLKMFGVYLGVDKLGHMFNQGYEYYKMYNEHLDSGSSPVDSLKSVIEWGRNSEIGSFGLLVDGVYSNGDLAANYAGFHFFQNLVEPITIGEKIYPSLLVINEDKTVSFNNESEAKPETVLRPLITDHLNEALNPSHYEKLVRVMVKKAIVKRCDSVRKFYEINSNDEIKSLTQSMSLWHGEDYGHRSDELLTISDLCF